MLTRSDRTPCCGASDGSFVGSGHGTVFVWARERMLAWRVRTASGASGRDLTVGAARFDRWDRAANIKPEGRVAASGRPDAGSGASG
jgi:hypothetical protein